MKLVLAIENAQASWRGSDACGGAAPFIWHLRAAQQQELTGRMRTRFLVYQAHELIRADQRFKSVAPIRIQVHRTLWPCDKP